MEKFLYPHTEVAEVLAPATSFETAHVVEDYPYGRLRTQMKYWVETKKGFGQRAVTCSLNPKNGKWNKPHAGTYAEVVALYKEVGTGHTQFAHFTFYDAPLAGEFLNTFKNGLTKEAVVLLNQYRIINEVKQERGTWDVEIKKEAFQKFLEWNAENK